VTSGNYVHIISLEVSVHSHPQLVGGSCTIIMYNYRGRNSCSLNGSILSLHLNFQSTDTNHHANMYALDGMHWMENNIINTALFSIITSEKKTTKNLCSLTISNKRYPRISKNIQEYRSSLALLSRFRLTDSERGTRQNLGEEAWVWSYDEI